MLADILGDIGRARISIHFSVKGYVPDERGAEGFKVGFGTLTELWLPGFFPVVWQGEN